ncbi:MAG: hypothetical protein ABI197_06555, partial [Granulicella sp.]
MEFFSSRIARRTLFVLVGLCVALEAWAAPYAMNADVISYFDLADLIQKHQWHWVVNAYWHPGYPALLFLTRAVMGSTVWTELQAARVLNAIIAGLLFLAVKFALNAAVELRTSLWSKRGENSGFEAIPRETLGIFAAAVTFLLVARDLNPSATLPDALLATLLVCGTGFLLRVAAQNKLWSYAGFGLAFGAAFLVKSVSFPLFLVSLVLLPFLAGSVKKAAKGGILAVLVFAAVAGPYIGALSHQKGRFTTGDSGSLNYAWYVDHADRFEQQKNDPSRYGLAKGELKHTSTEILTNPPVYDYGTARPGTSLQWFDPSYWNDGLKPRFNLQAQLARCRASALIVIQYFALRPQYLLLFLFLALLGARWNLKDFGPKGVGPVLLLLLAQLGMYFLVLTEPRYIGSAMLLALVILLVFLRVPKRDSMHSVLAVSAALFLGMLLCGSFTESLQHLKRENSVEGRRMGAYKRSTFTAAEALSKADGIHPGDSVACLGEYACRGDLYWARLAQVRIRTEIFADLNPPLSVWEKADKDQVKTTLQGLGVKAIVADFGANVTPP